MAENTAGQVSVGLVFSERQALEQFKNIERKLGNIRVNPNSFRPLGSISADFNKFNDSLEASNARVLAFGASAGAIVGLEAAFAGLVSSTFDVEKRLTDINVILGLNETNIKKFGDNLFEVAKNTGQAFKVVAEAATEFSRQGLGVEETLKRTQDALILTRLTGLDAKSAVEDLTAAVNTFAGASLTTSEIINKFANVDAAFAVSSADLAEGIKRSGAAAQDAGVSFDELVALVTSLQQTTARGGAVIGNSIKSIFTRIQRPEILDQLQELGVTVREFGKNLPAIDVLKNLAGTYGNLSQSQQSFISEQIGSIYQINQLKAAMSDLAKTNGIYDQSLKKSQSSTDQAITRNQELNKTLSAQLNATKQSITQFAADLGNSTINPSTKKVLEIANGVLDSLKGDTNSEQAGANIGKGLADGIGAYLSGPGLGLIAVGIAKLAARLGKDLFTAFSVILNINKEKQTQLVLEREIATTASAYPQLIEAGNKGIITQIELQNKLLLLTRERLVAEAEYATLFKNTANIGITKGATVSPKGKVVIPNFANNGSFKKIPTIDSGGIDSAIQREIASGISPDKIKVGKSPDLVNSKNPLGLGIYNTLDEPGGLIQGINRARQEKKNPKTYNIPNFASDKIFESTTFNKFALQGSLNFTKFIDNMVAQFKSGTVKLKDINLALESVKKQFGSTPAALKIVSQKITSAANEYQNKINKAANPVHNLGVLPTQIPLQAESLKKIQLISGKDYGNPTNPIDLIRQVEKEKNQKNPPVIPFYPASKYGEKTNPIDLIREIEKEKAKSISKINLPSIKTNESYGSSINPIDLVRENEKKAAQNKVSGKPTVFVNRTIEPLNQKPESLKSSQPSFNGYILPPKLVDSILSPKNIGPDYSKFEDRLVVKTPSASSKIQINQNNDRYIIPSSKPVFSNISKDLNSSREIGKTVGKELNKTFSPEKSARAQNAAFGISLAFPVLGGIAKQAIGNDTPGQRKAGAVTDVVSNTGSFAATGFLLGGGYGAAVGGLLGFLTSLPQVIKDFTSVLPDLQKQFTSLKDSGGRVSETLAELITINGELEDIEAGRKEIDIDKLQQLRRRKTSAESKIGKEDPNLLKNIFASNGSNESLVNLNTERLRKQNLFERFSQSEINLTAEKEKKKGFFGFGNDGLIEDKTKIIGKKNISVPTLGQNGVSSVNLETPVFAKKLGPDAEKATQELANILLEEQTDNGKSLVDAFTEDFKGGRLAQSAYFETLRDSLDKEDFETTPDEFIDFLKNKFKNNNNVTKQLNILKDFEPEKKGVTTKFLSDVLPLTINETDKRIKDEELIKKNKKEKSRLLIQGGADSFNRILSNESLILESQLFTKQNNVNRARKVERTVLSSNLGAETESQFISEREGLSLKNKVSKQNAELTGNEQVGQVKREISSNIIQTVLKKQNEFIRKQQDNLDSKNLPNEIRKQKQEKLNNFEETFGNGLKFDFFEKFGEELNNSFEQLPKLQEVLKSKIQTNKDILVNKEPLQGDVNIKDIEAEKDLYEKLLSDLNEIQIKGNYDIQAAQDELADNLDKLAIESENAKKNIAETVTAESYKRKVIFSDEFSSRRRTELNNRIRYDDNYSPGRGAAESFGNELKYNTKDLYRDINTGASDVAVTIKSSFSDAVKSIILDAKSIEDAFKGLATAILTKIVDKSVDTTTNILFSAVGSLTGLSKIAANSKGGIIKKYAMGGPINHYQNGAMVKKYAAGGIVNNFTSGGKVKGGSGVKDDVFAMLKAGDYVINKRAVKKFGESKLQKLASGGVAGGFGPLSNTFQKGKFQIDSNLSLEALEDSNNPQNALRDSQYSYSRDYLARKAQYQKQLKAFETNKKIGLYTAIGGAAIQVAGPVFNAYKSNQALNGSYQSNSAFRNTYQGTPPQYRVAALGGIMQAFAKGGDAKDDVPAMLMGGEYVVKKDTVDRYGKAFFDSINFGKRKHFAEGGSVGKTTTTIYPETTDTKDTTDNNRVVQILEKILETSKETTSEVNAGETNINISITVNEGKIASSNNTVEKQSTEKDKKTASADGYKELANVIQAEVNKILIKEKRAGGILSTTPR